MKSLADDQAKAKLLERLDNLNENSQGRWGKMDVNQMLCHLTDTFVLLQQESKPATPPSFLKKIQYKLMTWLAIHSGLPAPRGIPTAAAVDQERNGTPPIGFIEDKEKMIAAMHEFSAKNRSYENCFHPIFGDLTPDDWQRWGYVHVDHHFKQFGV